MCVSGGPFQGLHPAGVPRRPQHDPGRWSPPDWHKDQQTAALRDTGSPQGCRLQLEPLLSQLRLIFHRSANFSWTPCPFRKPPFKMPTCAFLFSTVFTSTAWVWWKGQFCFCSPVQILYVFYQLFSLLELVSVVTLVSLEFFSKKEMPNLRQNTSYIVIHLGLIKVSTCVYA